ncbi:Der GTPase-activating protein YihI [Thalassotalea piscium]
MSRIKKSRKPSFVATSTAKEDKKKELVVSDRKPKKKSGKESGNRQKEAMVDKRTAKANSQPKDPRIGSKKPIDLGQPVATPSVVKTKPNKKSPIAAIREVNTSETLEQELYAIEDDTQLQEILAKQEDDIALTEEEVDFFNEKMARHEALRELLGWSDDEEVTKEESKSTDEEALWDKLDKPNFSDFE